MCKACDAHRETFSCEHQWTKAGGYQPGSVGLLRRSYHRRLDRGLKEPIVERGISHVQPSKPGVPAWPGESARAVAVLTRNGSTAQVDLLVSSEMSDPSLLACASARDENASPI